MFSIVLPSANVWAGGRCNPAWWKAVEVRLFNVSWWIALFVSCGIFRGCLIFALATTAFLLPISTAGWFD